jgi:hypothetical protein
MQATKVIHGRVTIDDVPIFGEVLVEMALEYQEFIYQLKKNNRRAKRMRRHQRRAR